MDWILNHEAIPGHHYQFIVFAKRKAYQPPFSDLMFCAGYAEGWACYTEYLGKELGQYQTPEAELAKWEWDLVRSARVVLDVGIHFHGWTKAQAMDYWKANIVGQDDISEREINRVTNWATQAVSYKAGAAKIEEMRTELEAGGGQDVRKIHSAILWFGEMPLEVVANHFRAVFEGLK